MVTSKFSAISPQQRHSIPVRTNRNDLARSKREIEFKNDRQLKRCPKPQKYTLEYPAHINKPFSFDPINLRVLIQLFQLFQKHRSILIRITSHEAKVFDHTILDNHGKSLAAQSKRHNIVVGIDSIRLRKASIRIGIEFDFRLIISHTFTPSIVGVGITDCVANDFIGTGFLDVIGQLLLARVMFQRTRSGKGSGNTEQSNSLSVKEFFACDGVVGSQVGTFLVICVPGMRFL